MNLQKVYEYALQREQEGFRFFKKNAEKCTHAAAAEIFRTLAQEELKHINYLRRFLESTDENGGPAKIQLSKKDWFTSRAQIEKLDEKLIESLTPDITILRTAYLIERDLWEFYEMAARKSSGITNLVFSQLAEWEKEHEIFFKNVHDKLFHKYTEINWE